MRRRGGPGSWRAGDGRECESPGTGRIALLATLVVSGAVVLLSAGTGRTAPGPAAPWGAARVVAVDVLPERVVLDRPDAAVQLLLTARTADGASVDATRAATLVAPLDLVDVDARGLVRPRANGEGVLRFDVDGADVTVPVVVRNLGARFVPDFARDVMPILSRVGCNAGTCHGAASGKNGFKLSLRGYDPAADHIALTDDLSARRFDRVDPDQSLFLLKPTAAVPHGGGRVLDPASPDYGALRAWVEAGAPFDPHSARVERIRIAPEDPTIPLPGMDQQVRVIATYDDGSERDVTTHAFVETSDIEVTSLDDRGLVSALRRGEASILARYEGHYAATRVVVMGDRSGFEWPADEPEDHPVDALVNEKLRRVRVRPSPLCTDDEFLRRLRLDLTGTLPSVAEVRTFLLDGRPSQVKRTELVDRLIGSPEFVEYWTNKWCDLLQVTPGALGPDGAAEMREWIRGAVASDMPYDAFVRALLTSSGSTAAHPASGFYRILRDPNAEMEATTQLFLGVRFNCNKCHDHPFERWTQDQHWELAAYYGDVRRTPVEGQQDEVVDDGGKEVVQYPDGVRTASPRFPFPLPDSVPIPADAPLRGQLAAWLTAKENPYFATSFVNRVWSYLLGTGLIDPVDDIRAGNPPSNPALLSFLTERFVDGGFRFRSLLRLIVTSRSYQRSLQTDEWNADDRVDFSHAVARRLPAEVLFDAVHAATGTSTRLPGERPGTRAVELDDRRLDTADGFLNLFGRPARQSPCECERVATVSLGQALSLLNGETIAAAIDAPEGAIANLVRYEADDRAVADELFERFLSRPARPEELERLLPSLDARDPANLDALPPEEHRSYAAARAEWEAASRVAAGWHTLVVEPGAVAESGSALAPRDDGSLLLQGDAPDTDVLHLALEGDLARVTGLRLEVLPDESLPGGGPGRAENGNFVLNDLEVTAVPLGDPTGARPLHFSAATADFSQSGFGVAGAVDADPATGWAVSPRLGERHVAVLELDQDLVAPGGFVLVVRMDQHYGGGHTIGRLRFAATGDERPVRASMLPEDVQAALATAADARTPEQERLLHAAFLGTRPDLASAVRLAAARDLAWALVSSPAFLFNR